MGFTHANKNGPGVIDCKIECIPDAFSLYKVLSTGRIDSTKASLSKSRTLQTTQS